MRASGERDIRLASKLIWVLAACFVVQSVLEFHGRVNLTGTLGLSREALMGGRIWTLLTYQLLHSVPMPFHVLANCLGLYFFGRRVEERLGWRRFAWIYVLGGVAGGLLQVMLGGLLGHGGPIVGASAGVCAVMATFCRLSPDDRAMFSLYFIPIEMRASILLWVLVAYDAWCTVFPVDRVAHIAHLGGYGIGTLAVRWMDAENRSWTAWWRIPGRHKPRLTLVRDDPRAAKARPRDRAVRRADDWSKDIDPILDKIAAQGLHSLTEVERSMLEKARKRMTGNSPQA